MFSARIETSAPSAVCAILKLLDAAHIVPDTEPEGEPVVPNGIALCRLHHAAFDRFFLAVRPDHIIEVRGDVLMEIDGPTLEHAIQGLHGQSIVLPARVAERPAPEALSYRYERFLEVARRGEPFQKAQVGAVTSKM